MHRLPRLSLALVACWIAAPSAHAGPSDQLQALRASERAISDANRRLFRLTERSRDGKAVMTRLEAQRARAEESAQTQQALLAKLVYQQYLSGQPEPLRLLLNRQDPDELARQMYYLGYVTRARADLIATLRRDLSDIERLSREVQDKTAELG